MNLASSPIRVGLAASLLAALFALGCSSTDPPRSDSVSPGSTEHAAPDPDAETIAPPASGRVVGYLPTYRSLDPSTLDLDTLTHINIAFAVPTTEKAGSAIDFEDTTPAEITTLVAAAHQKNVKVLAALGGAVGGARVARVLALDSGAFVKSTVAFVARYGLDGIDIDIEGDDIVSAPYEKLVTGLVAQLPTGKLLTAAVANYRQENYRALDKLSFLNVMSYDEFGTWSERGEHSTFANAKRDLEFWSTNYWQAAGGHYEKANIVLGLPFYGYCWGKGCSEVTREPTEPASATYQRILEFWNEIHPGTQEPVPDLLQDDARGYYLSLNGPQTIAKKVSLAKDYGGVMIWELGQDARDQNSLFSVIEKAR